MATKTKKKELSQAAKKETVNKLPNTGGVVTENLSEEQTSHVREENLINEPAEGKKTSNVIVDEKVSPIDDPTRIEYIAPPDVHDTGTRTHHIRTSRGEEVGFYQMPQSGIFNNTNLKA